MDTATPNRETQILIIDDDRDIVQTLRGNLLLDGYQIITAFDGRSGLKLAAARRPDLIILDLNLPDIDGIKACEVIRREFDFPILMLSARDGVSDKVLGLQCGADDYMVKPFDYLELSARIQAILQRVARTVVRDRQRFDRLTIHYNPRAVHVDDIPVKLTQTEFELLTLFAAHPAETLSREFIQRQIWSDSQHYSHSRALDVHVQRLRKKIEPTPEFPRYIQTVTGVGYRFTATDSQAA